MALEHQRQAERAEAWAPWYVAADFIRRSHAAVRRARAVAATLGPGDPNVWPLLELAARLEVTAFDIEADLDHSVSTNGRAA